MKTYKKPDFIIKEGRLRACFWKNEPDGPVKFIIERCVTGGAWSKSYLIKPFEIEWLSKLVEEIKTNLPKIHEMLERGDDNGMGEE